MITPPILQLKCGVLMQDRCMKADDHATYPSAECGVLMQDRCMKGDDHATYPSAEMWCSDAG